MKKIKVIIAVLALTLISSLAMAYEFGDKWDFGKCTKCNKILTHVGKDIMKPHGKGVYFNRVGTVKQIYNDATWKTCVVIESNKTTYIIWHLNAASSDVKKYLGKEYDSKKNGNKPLYLGDVASLSTGDHIHLGQRNASYGPTSTLSTAGALPQCDHKYKDLPKYPEKFVTPDQSVLSFK